MEKIKWFLAGILAFLGGLLFLRSNKKERKQSEITIENNDNIPIGEPSGADLIESIESKNNP